MTDLPSPANPSPGLATLVRGQQPSKEELRLAVRQKLKESLLWRLSGRRAIWQQADVIGYRLHTWTSEALLACAAAGVSHPVLSAMLPPAPGAGNPPSGAPASTASVLQAFESYPGWAATLFAGVFLGWLALRVWVGTKKLADRGPQILACERELGVLEGDLEAALAEEKPMKPLLDLVSRSKEVVDRYYKADLWPWPIGPDGQDDWIVERAEKLCAKFQGSWKPE